MRLSPGRVPAAVGGAALVGASAMAADTYPGGPAAFWGFTAAMAGLGALVLVRPRSHGYTALALFLVLGFWAKAVAHLVLSYPYIEPTGAFRGGGMAWDRVLSVATVAALGAIAARVLFLAALWRRPRAGRDPAPALPPPGWYARYRAWAWGACLLAVVLVAGWNSVAAFYQIGVQPKLLLPLRLHILPAWLVSIGFGLALAALVQWEWARSPRALPLALTGAVLEAALSSASALRACEEFPGPRSTHCATG